MAAIIGIGSALLDVLARVPESFLDTVRGAKGGMELITPAEMAALMARLPTETVRAPGGSAANTIVALGRLGHPVKLLAKVGADADGEFYIANARNAGVAEDAFKISPTEPTGACISLVTPDSERTLRPCLGAAATLSESDVTRADFAGCVHAHIEGYMLFNRDLALHLLNTACNANCSVSLDLSSPEVVAGAMDILPDLLENYVDMVFANEEETAAFAGTEDPRAGLETLAAHCALAVVKLGPRGALIQRGSEHITIDACEAKAIDTTGAGDYWAAGFLYGLFTGRSPLEAGRLGARIAARVVTFMGATLPDAEWDAINASIH